MKKKSLVLFSGGIDSYVAMTLEKQRGSDLVSLSFKYDGQPKPEIRAIKKISEKENIPNYLINHPKITSRGRIGRPVQFMPDNLLYYSMAISFSKNNGINRIVGGQNKDDMQYSIDAESAFYDYLNNLISNTYPNNELIIVQPLLKMTKLEVVKKGLELKIPLELTWSCQGLGPEPCMDCSNCRSRKRISEELGIKL